MNAWLFANHPIAAGPAPAGYTWSLGLLYAVFAVCVDPALLPVPLVRRVTCETEIEVAQLHMILVCVSLIV